MAISGAWKAGAVTPSEYAGSLKWGTGINPVHAMPDSHPSWTTKEPLGTTDDGATMPETLLGPAQWGYSAEDAALFPGEDYRYVNTDHPNWGQDSSGRGDRGGPGAYEQLPGDYPPWGPAGADDPDWPLAGYPGGDAFRAVSGQAEVELIHQIAVPTRGVSGGWLNKQHGDVLEARTSDPSQYEVTTSMRQLHETRVNTQASARGTDDPRSPIATRLTGMKVKSYAKSVGMGGGPGSPDMALAAQDLPYRPWYFRTGGLPPAEAHTWNEVTYFDPLERSLPPDAGEQVTIPESPAPAAGGSTDYGYAGGDYFA